ncbi:MAG: toprim domain-containing protein, partial [Flavisolibacter sp.]|nr:toprim domain-containing protein [Flavisolibacter sp.]
EKTASFKVDRKKNLWYDHGLGRGGNLVDFGVLFYSCTVTEFLQKLERKTDLNFSFHPPLPASETTSESEEKRLIVMDEKPITSLHLCRYLYLRRIVINLAQRYLKEVSFELKGKQYTALGFRNNSGGFELRNEHFKGGSSPKDVTFIINKSETITVFEGFFSFLSYLSLAQQVKQENGSHLSEGQTNFLILNSLSFFEKSRSVMEGHISIQLYLDRDLAGLKATQEALNWSQKYKDKSIVYSQHKDLNDFLIHQQKPKQRQSLRSGRHL